MEKLLTNDATALSQLLAAKEISAEELTKAYLAQIEKGSALNVYITITDDVALQAARGVDEERAAGQSLSPLAGVPMALKDNICTKNIKTTCASRLLKDFVPPYSAFVAEQLQQAGCLLLGKTNLDEFSMGNSNQTGAFGGTQNPLNPAYVPGGSSGGSAAAVAANQAAFALGTDTGGSVRQPAAYCGVVGMRPTYGAVSRRGVVPLASSMDQVSTLTKSVQDAALIMDYLYKKDGKDSTSVDFGKTDFTSALTDDIKGLNVAVPQEFFGAELASDNKKAVRHALDTLQTLGATLTDIEFPYLEQALPAYTVLSSAEGSSNMGRFDGVHYGARAEHFDDIDDLYKNSRGDGFGFYVKNRILFGAYVLNADQYDAYYKKAQQVRTLIIRYFETLFEEYDVVVTPTTPTTAFKIGTAGNEAANALSDMYTVVPSLAGLPALSLPCGKDKDGLPIGLQLVGKPFGERKVLQAAAALEAKLRGANK